MYQVMLKIILRYGLRTTVKIIVLITVKYGQRLTELITQLYTQKHMTVLPIQKFIVLVLC